MDLRSHGTNRSVDVRDVAGAAAEGARRGGAVQSAAYRVALAVVRPLERMAVRVGVSADAVTLASLAVALVAGVVASCGPIALAGVLYLAAGALDLLDGRIARATGTASARGAALDSIVDRFSEAIVVGGLAWSLRGGPGAALCVAFVLGSMLVSYARARGEGLGVCVDSGAMGRGPRVALLSFAMILEGAIGQSGARSPWFLGGLLALTIATAITAVRRTIAVLSALPGPDRGAAGARPERRVRGLR